MIWTSKDNEEITRKSGAEKVYTKPGYVKSVLESTELYTGVWHSHSTVRWRTGPARTFPTRASVLASTR